MKDSASNESGPLYAADADDEKIRQPLDNDDILTANGQKLKSAQTTMSTTTGSARLQSSGRVLPFGFHSLTVQAQLSG